MNTRFYTIMLGDKFINSNFMCKDTSNIVNAIKFTHREDAEECFKNLRTDLSFKIVKVECNLRMD